jgi:hypothetical protein
VLTAQLLCLEDKNHAYLQGDKEAEGSEEAVEGEEGDVLEGGEGADDDEYEKEPPSPSAEDHDDGDSNLVDIGYLLN